LKLAEFLGSQFAVFGPIPFALFLFLIAVRFGRLCRDDRFWLLIAFALPQLALVAIEAFLSRANANWGRRATSPRPCWWSRASA